MRLFDRSLGFAAVLSVCTLWGSGAMAQTAPTASEQDLQRELLLRMVGTDSEVLLGQLPPELAIDLPLPDQARIVGSITSSRNGLGSSLIFLDVPQSPQQVATSYQEQLRRAGWREPEDLSSPGFVSTDGAPFELTSSFCKDDQFLVLSVAVLPNPQAATVTMQTTQLSDQSYSTCNRSEPAIEPIPVTSIPLPELTAPPNTPVQPVSSSANSSSGSRDFRSIAIIESSLTNQALVAHYVLQLEQAGWRQQANDTTDQTAWSFLTLRDEEGQQWQGLLSIIPGDEPNTHIASIIVHSIQPPSPEPTPLAFSSR